MLSGSQTANSLSSVSKISNYVKRLYFTVHSFYPIENPNKSKDIFLVKLNFFSTMRHVLDIWNLIVVKDVLSFRVVYENIREA